MEIIVDIHEVRNNLDGSAGKQSRPKSDCSLGAVWSGSTLFAISPFCQQLVTSSQLVKSRGSNFRRITVDVSVAPIFKAVTVTWRL